MACLRVYIDDLSRGVFTLFNREIVIGRDRNCALVLLGLDVARRHAVIHKEGHCHVLSSTSSKGVRVQASVIGSPVILNHGEIVQIGPYTLVYETPPAEDSWSQRSQQNKAATGGSEAPFILAIVEKGQAEKTFPIRKASVQIGRGSDNDIVLRDPSVSQHHAVLERQADRFFLRDLKSTNGTRVGGQRIDAMAVGIGVKIGIGKTTLHLQRRGEAAGKSALVGQSASAQQVMAAAEAAGGSAGPVQIVAEVGCEARPLAEEIHRRGPAPEAPFVAIDCDTLSDIEATREIFGVPSPEDGAEASHQKGVFKSLHKGTVFLERVDCLGEPVRSALWQMLRERAVRSSHAGDIKEINPRIIISLPPGGCDMPADVDFCPITIPPLRERIEDIPLLIEHLGLSVSPAALEMLMRHAWPGNVHELQNTLERVAIIASKKILQAEEILFFRNPSTIS